MQLREGLQAAGLLLAAPRRQNLQTCSAAVPDPEEAAVQVLLRVVASAPLEVAAATRGCGGASPGVLARGALHPQELPLRPPDGEEVGL